MRYSQRLFAGWVVPLRALSSEEEQRAVFQLLALDRVFKEKPLVARRFADRSLSKEVRTSWLIQTMGLSVSDPVILVVQRLLAEEGMGLLPAFFQDYLRFRERRGLGRLYLVKTQSALTDAERKQIQLFLEKRFSQPATLYPISDPTVKAGARIESLDGWVLDATLEGRLNRLVLSLA